MGRRSGLPQGSAIQVEMGYGEGPERGSLDGAITTTHRAAAIGSIQGSRTERSLPVTQR